MNKAILMGRLTRDPDVRWTQGPDQRCTARYTLAVDRRTKAQEGQQNADFISCIVFGKGAEFAEKYLWQGTKIAITGGLVGGGGGGGARTARRTTSSSIFTTVNLLSW